MGVLQQLPVGHCLFNAESQNYVFVMVASRWIFNEPVTPRQWLGVITIILGVSLIGSHL
ncbi:EamA family transporter [Vibrio sp. PP-XX7]